MARSISPCNLNDLEERYRCCCNLINIRTAVIIVALVELVYFIFEVYSTFYLFIETGDEYILSFSLSLFGLLLALIAIILLFVAIWTSTPYLFVPHLLMQVAAILVLCIMCLFCIFIIIAGTSVNFRMITIENSPEGEFALRSMKNIPIELNIVTSALTNIIIAFIFLLVLLIAFQIWALFVVIKCFLYVQEKAYHKMQSGSHQTDLNLISSLTTSISNDKCTGMECSINDILGTDLKAVSVSSSDVRDFTNPAETDC